MGDLVVAALLIGAVGAYAALRVAGGDSPAVGGATATGSRATSAPSATRSATTTAAGSPTTTAAGSPTTASPTKGSPTVDAAVRAAERALAACTAQVAAQQRLADAAAASARDWAIHTGAQVKLDTGTFTLAQAKGAWASSKARGAQDLRSFAAASAAVEAAGVGCRTVVADTRATGRAATGQACASRSAALADVAAKGAVVNAQWAAHIAMMADREHTDTADYHDRWVAMVRSAGPALGAYQSSASKLSSAPACR